ncbi:hypothetical protein F5883DRAFT_539532 [Diaporthe sp. PMI_573]|nr:hypothetical protein F5883DRAFT_539532 [Diaporthaceae sp. PMI_573]
MIVSQQTKEPSPLFRLLLVNSFASLYLIFVIILGVRLHSWDDEVVGACYHTMLLSASSSKHPLVDKIYLAITSFYMFFTLVLSTQRPTERLMKTLWSNQESESQQERIMVRLISLSLIATLPFSPKSWESLFGPDSSVTSHSTDQDGIQMDSLQHNMSPELGVRSWWESIPGYLRDMDNTISTALPQAQEQVENPSSILSLVIFPSILYGYMAFAARQSNNLYLSGESENQWGFGHIVPLVLLVSVISDCLGAFVKYHSEKSKSCWKRWSSAMG